MISLSNPLVNYQIINNKGILNIEFNFNLIEDFILLLLDISQADTLIINRNKEFRKKWIRIKIGLRKVLTLNS